MKLVLATVAAVLACAAAIALPTGANAAGSARAGTQLAHVVVPAYCEMPRQRLRNGHTLRRYLPKEGTISAPMRVHLRRSGGTQSLATFDCTAGGVGWPQVLVLYSRTKRLIGSLKLGNYGHSEHANVTHWRAIAGHKVAVRWVAYEGAGFDVHHYRSLLIYRRSHLELASRAALAHPGGCQSQRQFYLALTKSGRRHVYRTGRTPYGVENVQCARSWSVAGVTETFGGAPNTYTVVEHRLDGAWRQVDRDRPCRRHVIPSRIYAYACETN